MSIKLVHTQLAQDHATRVRDWANPRLSRQITNRLPFTVLDSMRDSADTIQKFIEERNNLKTLMQLIAEAMPQGMDNNNDGSPQTLEIYLGENCIGQIPRDEFQKIIEYYNQLESEVYSYNEDDENDDEPEAPRT